MIKFGIVIATWQRPDGMSLPYLQRCLESINLQTHKNYKVFLIGDKYEDNEEFIKLATTIIPQDKIYFENLPNAKERELYYPHDLESLWKYGGLTAVNYGLDKSVEEGFDFICRLDHDDAWGQDHLENFNECISTTGAQFVCSLSTYMSPNSILPQIPHTTEKYIPFIPKPGKMIKSSACFNQKLIPFRSRNILEETGERGDAGDFQLWGMVGKYIQDNNISSYLVNRLTCGHDTEGYTKKIKI
jgi:glycosyltransferase involved in cell wall biosynthesis